MTVANQKAEPADPDVANLARGMIELGPTDFTRDAMLGAALVLEVRENPLRLNLFASTIRIFLDHMMDALAPQDDVQACPWFALVEGQDKPTRNQRLTYALHGGFTAAQVEALTGIEMGPLIREVIAAYGKLNKHVHGREDTIVRDLGEQDEVADAVLSALAELLNAYRGCREEILDGIADSLKSETVEAFTTEVVEDIDILATHHTVDWVGIDEQRVVGITATYIEYEVEGSVGVTLLYGEGAELTDQFPISMRFKVPLASPGDLQQAEITSAIDTSSWYGEGEDIDPEI
jgi:hypothetical protein